MLPSDFTVTLRGFSNATLSKSMGSAGSACLAPHSQNILAIISGR